MQRWVHELNEEVASCLSPLTFSFPKLYPLFPTCSSSPPVTFRRIRFTSFNSCSFSCQSYHMGLYFFLPYFLYAYRAGSSTPALLTLWATSFCIMGIFSVHWGIFTSLCFSLAFIHRIPVAAPNFPICSQEKLSRTWEVVQLVYSGCIMSQDCFLEPSLWNGYQPRRFLYPPPETLGCIHFLFLFFSH